MATVTKTAGKTILIPYVSDHGVALTASLTAHGIASIVLPPSNETSIALGSTLVNGKECLPCLVSTGDIVQFLEESDLDAGECLLLMPTTSGPCRFGQYTALQRTILDQRGLQDLELISPSAANSYRGFGDRPAALRSLMWQGIVAIDSLQKLLHEYRPYEVETGQTERIYRHCLAQIAQAVKEDGGKRLVQAMQWVAGEFGDLAVDRRQRRPVIGLVGEFFLRFHEFSNQQVIGRVEEAGGEVMLAPMMEWLYYTNWAVKSIAWYRHLFKEYVAVSLTNLYQRRTEHRLIKPVEHLLTYPYDTPMGALVEKIRPHFEPYLGTEAVLSLGKAIDYAQHGLSGIVNVMPFSCMPGIITAGMATRIRQDLDNIPWLDISFDGQGGTNIHTRLEAFMYQATQYQQRHATLAFTQPTGV